MTYAVEQLFEEIAYVAYHFHWPHEEIVGMEHLRRRAFIREIAKINKRLNDLAERES